MHARNYIHVLMVIAWLIANSRFLMQYFATKLQRNKLLFCSKMAISYVYGGIHMQRPLQTAYTSRLEGTTGDIGTRYWPKDKVIPPRIA